MRSRISIRVCPSVHSSVGPKRILSDASYAEYSALLENALWTNGPTDGRMNIEQTLLSNKAEYSALAASRRRLREGVSDLRTGRPSYRDAAAHLKTS